MRLFHYTGLFSRKIPYYIEQDSGSFNEYNEVIAVALVTNEQAIKALRNYSVSVTAIGNKMLRKTALYAIIFL